MNQLRGRLTNLGEAAHGCRQELRSRAQQKVQRAQEMYEQGEYSQLGSSLQHYVTDRANMNAQALKDVGFGIKDRAGTEWEKRKKDAERKLFDLAGPVRDAVLLALREAVKKGALADPDMCNCVRNRFEELIDLFWDDLLATVSKSMEDAKQSAVGNQTTDVNILAELGDEPCLLGPRWWRAKILYHLLPFDLSIFGNFRDPFYYPLLILMCMPCFSFLPPPLNYIPVRVPFFTLYLVLVVTGCPADEFQLVQYIMSIKGLQFICSGIGMMCYAAYTYYMCVHPGGKHTCDDYGPGAAYPVVVSIIDWFGTCVLVWIAFLWLPCSVRSAGIRDPVEEQEEEQEAVVRAESQGESGNSSSGCCGSLEYSKEKGGRLRAWLGYDLTTFVLSVVAFYLLLCIDKGNLRPHGKPSQGWPSPKEISTMEAIEQSGHVAVYWARVIYALFSLPFLLFWIPGLQGILTHTRMTGYNRKGLCVPYMLHPMPKEKKDKDRMSNSNQAPDNTNA